MADLAFKAIALGSKLIGNKIRDQIVIDLKRSDVTGQCFRELIIQPVAELKEKLHGLARVDLLSSLNFIEEGLNLLHEFLERVPVEENQDKVDATNLVKCLAVPLDSPDGPRKALHSSDIDKLANSILEEAKHKFEESTKCAVRAISNDALKLNERVFAARLRIIGTILTHLDSIPICLIECKCFLSRHPIIPINCFNNRFFIDRLPGKASMGTFVKEDSEYPSAIF